MNGMSTVCECVKGEWNIYCMWVCERMNGMFTLCECVRAWMKCLLYVSVWENEWTVYWMWVCESMNEMSTVQYVSVWWVNRIRKVSCICWRYGYVYDAGCLRVCGCVYVWGCARMCECGWVCNVCGIDAVVWIISIFLPVKNDPVEREGSQVKNCHWGLRKSNQSGLTIGGGRDIRR